MSRIPGIQYPAHLSGTPTDDALRNVFDNLFYLRKQLDGLVANGGLTQQQVEKIANDIFKSKTVNFTAATIIVGTHAIRLITAPTEGAAFYETDTEDLYIGSDASGTLAWAPIAAGTGDVTGPAVSVDGDVAVFNGTTGKIIKDLAGPSDATKFLNGAAPPAYAKVKDSDLSTSDITTNNVTSTKHGFAPKSAADATKFLNSSATPAYAQVKDSDLSTSDITTNDVTSTKHGFAPKSPADATKFLNGAATPAYAQVKDSDLSTSDITTNNVTIAKHGFTPKLPNDATKYLDGTGAYTVPAGSGGGDVTGPGVAVDGNVTVFNGTTGKIIKQLVGPADATKFLNGAASPAYAAVKDSDLSLTNITTNNVSAAKHGFAPILPGVGGVYLDGNGNYSSPASSGSGNMFGFTPTAPVPANFAWINQGTATLTTTLGIYIQAQAAAGNDIKIQKMAAPATPYVITAAFSLLFVKSSSQAGLIFRESSSGKLIFFSIFATNNDMEIRVYKMTNPTTFSSDAFDGTIVSSNLIFMRIADDGVNRICSYSTDSVNWIAVFTEARATFLTANEVGFAVNAGQATLPAGITLLSWA